MMATPDPKHPQTLADWNHDRRQYWQGVRDKVMRPEAFWNGLHCDACGGQLYDTGQTKIGVPVEMRVKCMTCGSAGYRLE
jgi:hypothetical protein